MSPETSPLLAAVPAIEEAGFLRTPKPRAESAGRRHWLHPQLVMHTTATLTEVRLSPSVVDVEEELAFWRRHHQRTGAWHRDVLPFNEYVPAFTLGISLFLQCHDYALEAFDEQILGLRYARVRRYSRVEWHEARQAVHASFQRLQSHWESTPARLTEADAMPTHYPHPGAGAAPSLERERTCKRRTPR